MEKTQTQTDADCRCNVLTMLATIAMVVTLIVLIVMVTINWTKWNRIESMLHGHKAEIEGLQEEHRLLHPAKD